MAARTLSLEELKNMTMNDLFAFSGSKFVEQTQWADQQRDEIFRFPTDTFHKQGHLVQTMVNVFEKTDRKEKTKALCTLAGSLWFAHDKVYEDLIDKRLNLADVNLKLVETEEESLSLLAEKCQLEERLLQMQRDRENEAPPPPSGGANGNDESDKDDVVKQLYRELDYASEEVKIAHAQIDNLKSINRRQVDAMQDLQSQNREYQKRCDNYQTEIHELEKSLRKRSKEPSGCDGSCKERLKMLEEIMWNTDKEIEDLKNQVKEETDRYWDSHNSVYARELSIKERESEIVDLKRENHKLTKLVKENKARIADLQTRLTTEENRRATHRLPRTSPTPRKGEESESAESSDDSEPRQEKKAFGKPRKTDQGGKHRKRAFFQPCPSTDDESDLELPEITKHRNKNKKGERRSRHRSGEEAASHPSVKSIKDLKGMLPSFTQSNKTASVLEHLSLYERLMETLDLGSDEDLKTCLFWTFAPDSQSFFSSTNIDDFDTWTEYRSEVIQHFSPHRNSHEALRSALDIRCEKNQNPRDYLQQLKNAFAQVQRVVNPESRQFKQAYFHGLPWFIKNQLARDFNDRKSIGWIYKQAKSVYDVSRTEERAEAKDKPKPSKICEVSKEKVLPFETGGAKPRPVPKEKERKKSPERNVASTSAKEPETQKPISPRYKGSRPINNYVYKNKENPEEPRAGAEKERPRENERREQEPYRPREPERQEREPYPPREREGGAPSNPWQGGYDRPESSSYARSDYDFRERERERGREEPRPYADHRDRYQQWDERPRSPHPPNRLIVLEEQVKDLIQNCRKMASKDSGPSPRVHAASLNEPPDRNHAQPGQ